MGRLANTLLDDYTIGIALSNIHFFFKIVFFSKIFFKKKKIEKEEEEESNRIEHLYGKTFFY